MYQNSYCQKKPKPEYTVTFQIFKKNQNKLKIKLF